jgi:Fe-S-cluster-containing dehydrogenase component/anaerobic selenocysteine-containing dehydrogenase
MKPVPRRTFLAIAGATTGAAAASDSKRLAGVLVPYVQPPENIRPGVWVDFATTCRECPAGCGMWGRHRDGRVVKVEGNPEHPVNKGGLCPRGQSSVQGLYDPDRVIDPLFAKTPGHWDDAFSKICEKIRNGAKVSIISDLQTGTLAQIMSDFLKAFNNTDLFFYEAFNYEYLKRANKDLFGSEIIPRYKIDKCDFVLSLGADFLETWISPVEYTLALSDIHSLQNNSIAKYAYIGPRYSMTAASADYYYQVTPSQIKFAGAAILKSLLDTGAARANSDVIRGLLSSLGNNNFAQQSGIPEDKLNELAAMIGKSKQGIVFGGPVAARNSSEAYEIALISGLLNSATGATNTVVDYSTPHALSCTTSEEKLNDFLNSLDHNDLIFLHNTNILFTRPDSLAQLKKAGMIVGLSTLYDETAEVCDIVLPIDSYLETWGDYEPYKGIHSILQPVMGRLHKNTRSSGDIFIDIANRCGKPLYAGQSFFDKLKGHWNGFYTPSPALPTPGAFWTAVLRNGGYSEQNPSSNVSLKSSNTLPRFEPETTEGLKLWVWPSIKFFDGRLANRPWMQEVSEPMSTSTWASWIDIHPSVAKKHSLKTGDFALLKNGAGEVVRAWVRVTSDVNERVVAIMAGQGHSSKALHTAYNIGANAFILINSKNPLFGTVDIGKGHGAENFADISASLFQYGRNVLKTVPLDKIMGLNSGEGEKIIMPLESGYKKDRDLYPPHGNKRHRWAMVIDIQRCTGCQGCVVACYAENNVAVVGKEQVKMGREMAWLRVQPYRHKENESRISFLPLPCQHCDAAPCEPVCPVFASVHTSEGLNAQIYNRCIGTRDCGNNCPYKVRRFNWADYRFRTPLNVQLNPEVTVRARGVMEKCTFCVQRIKNAEFRASVEFRKLRDGEVLPACVQSCPAKVYTFGDLLDPDSKVSKMFGNPRRYQLLKELNTKPAVVYLKKIVIT